MRLVLSILAALLFAGAADADDVMPPLQLPASYVPRYECARTFYVDPAHGRPWRAYRDGGGAQDKPWASVQDANDAMAGGAPVLRAGDCVNLASGEYPLDNTITLTRGGGANRADGYVVYRAAERHGAHLIARARFYQIINVRTAYIVIDGLEIDGADATSQGEAVAALGDAAHHHIVVENCIIHGAGGGGVQLNDSEYFWVVGNLIYNNAATNPYQESGVSIYQPQAAAPFAATPDDAIPFHIIIAGNISRDNAERHTCGRPGCHTDGNGIIIDKTLNVDRPHGVPYAGRTLVIGNLVHGNGGGGVHLFLSQHVVVANNTAFNNHVDTDNNGTWRGELSNVDSDDTLWVNNIGWAVPGLGVLADNSAILSASTGAHPIDSAVWRNNLTFGGRAVGPAIDAAHNMLNVDPRLVDVMGGDFTPRLDSLARGAGAPQPFIAASAPNIGAY